MGLDFENVVVVAAAVDIVEDIADAAAVDLSVAFAAVNMDFEVVAVAVSAAVGLEEDLHTLLLPGPAAVEADNYPEERVHLYPLNYQYCPIPAAVAVVDDCPREIAIVAVARTDPAAALAVAVAEDIAVPVVTEVASTAAPAVVVRHPPKNHHRHLQCSPRVLPYRIIVCLDFLIRDSYSRVHRNCVRIMTIVVAELILIGVQATKRPPSLMKSRIEI